MVGFVKWVVSHLGWWWWFGRWGCGAFGPFGGLRAGRLRAGRLRMALRAGKSGPGVVITCRHGAILTHQVSASAVHM